VAGFAGAVFKKLDASPLLLRQQVSTFFKKKNLQRLS
jgi:hypothetical protein